MFDFLDGLNKRTLLVISIIGLVSTLIGLVVSFIIRFEYQTLICIPVALFTYLLCIAKGMDSWKCNNTAVPILVITFFIIYPIDLASQYYYDKNDFVITKGYIYESKVRVGRHTSGYIHYTFNVNGKLWSDTKPKSIWKNLRLNEGDSIYVVYAQSNSKINDVYALDEIPESNPRENIVLYTLKNISLIEWLIALIAFVSIVRYMLFTMKKQ